MKKLKTVSIIVFLVSVILFVGYTLKEKTANDPAGPVIEMESDNIAVSVSDGREALLQGVKATDARDGDVTDSVLVESVSPFNEEGNRIVRYVAFDSDGHVANALRTMSYTDYTDPVIEITRPLSFSTEAVNLLEGVKAQDCIDGDISGLVQVLFDGETDPKLAGTYPARLKVRNSAGGTAEIPVTYEIYNAAEYDRLPRLNLDTYLLYLKKGEEFNAADHLKSAVIGGKEYSFVGENGSYGAAGMAENAAKNTDQFTIDQSLVAVTGEVDANTTGCYEVNYSLSDGVFGTGTGTSRLYVVITEGGAE